MSHMTALVNGWSPGSNAPGTAMPFVWNAHAGSARSTSGQYHPALNQRPLDFKKPRMELLSSDKVERDPGGMPQYRDPMHEEHAALEVLPGDGGIFSALQEVQECGCCNNCCKGDELRCGPRPDRAAILVGADDLDQVPNDPVANSEHRQCLPRHTLTSTHGKHQDQQDDSRERFIQLRWMHGQR